MCATIKCKGTCGKSYASCGMVNGKCWKCRQNNNSVVTPPLVSNNITTPPNTPPDVYHT